MNVPSQDSRDLQAEPGVSAKARGPAGNARAATGITVIESNCSSVCTELQKPRNGNHGRAIFLINKLQLADLPIAGDFLQNQQS